MRISWGNKTNQTTSSQTTSIAKTSQKSHETSNKQSNASSTSATSSQKGGFLSSLKSIANKVKDSINNAITSSANKVAKNVASEATATGSVVRNLGSVNSELSVSISKTKGNKAGGTISVASDGRAAYKTTFGEAKLEKEGVQTSSGGITLLNVNNQLHETTIKSGGAVIGPKGKPAIVLSEVNITTKPDANNVSSNVTWRVTFDEDNAKVVAGVALAVAGGVLLSQGNPAGLPLIASAVSR